MTLPTDRGTINLETRLRRSVGRMGRTSSINVKVSAEERMELNQCAAANQQAASEWAREVLLATARRKDDNPVLTEIVATRLLVLNLIKPLLLHQSVDLNWFTNTAAAVRREKRKVAAETLREYESEIAG